MKIINIKKFENYFGKYQKANNGNFSHFLNYEKRIKKKSRFSFETHVYVNINP